MKTNIGVKLVALTTATLSMLATFNPAQAVTTFGKKEVDPTKFIVVSQPLPGNLYKLLVFEQVSTQRDCWSESGSQPTTVNPLLLNFDFTGICGRSVDSNGYSIRMADEDLSWRYSLRIVQEGNDLVLLGVPASDPNGPTLKIGRTYGVSDSFAKIVLNPGWRLTKRTYQDKTLGHVYFTSDVTLGGQLPPDTTTPPPTGTTLTDIANDIYAREINEAVKTGFVAGFKDNTFRPQETLTREQLVSMVVESLIKIPNANVVLPNTVTTRPYSDVEASRWSAVKIQWARDNKVVSGYEDGSFRPSQPVTRAEMIAVLRRAAEKGKALRGLPTTLVPKQQPKAFSDTTGHWAAATISQMSGYCGVASAFNESGTAFLPNTQARRNYAAAATLRMLNCVKADQ